RRYQLKYNVVGGFSFYERAEIKDMISYLKVVANPDDSVSLLRVINTPARGIGKTTLETLERLALETGLSLWGTIGQAMEGQLLPVRAVQALKNFHELIEDTRAMRAGTYVERLEQDVAQALSPAPVAQGEPTAFVPAAFEDPEEQATEFDPLAFDFGDEASSDADPWASSGQAAHRASEPDASSAEGTAST